MARSVTHFQSNGSMVVHALDPADAPIVAQMRAFAAPAKGVSRGIEARPQYDAFMESVSPRDDVKFEADTVGGVSGLWVHPANVRSGGAILHLHGGWFNLGSANTYRHLVAQIVARVRTSAFIPDYRLAPEYQFPAATDDVWSCYLGLVQKGPRRIAVTGDSAGGNLGLGLAARVIAGADATATTLVGVAVFSPVTDLTLSGETYETRADADPLFTRPQVAELVKRYLGGAEADGGLASPLFGAMYGLPPILVHVGDDEVLLDDSRRYVDRAISAGVDARLEVWSGMPHGFIGSVGRLKAAGQSLDAVGDFLSEKLRTHGQ
ncbi:MAG TPA: alpha/beta hydrolase [Xanthobacteraceae bacterium]